MGRTLVIGDIHGGFRALEQALDRALPQPDDRLIFLGDYVDGWSQSPEVLDYLIGLADRYDCVFIKGNHDAWFLDWLGGIGASPDWLFHGGRATVDSYTEVAAERKARHLEFLERMRLYFEDAHRRLYIHAGFCSMHGPGKEHFPNNFFWDRTLWEMALIADNRIPPKSIFYPKRLLLYDEIYIGHTPTTNYDIEVPMHKCNVWNVDTGAAFLGKLTVLDADSKKFWQSDVVQQLYPSEKGRNK